MRDVAVAGVGHVPFGRHDGATGPDLGVDALRRALQDAGLDWESVDLVVAGSIAGGLLETWEMVRRLHWTGVAALTVENASATGSTAFSEAVLAVAAGRCDAAVAVGFEQLGPMGLTGLFVSDSPSLVAVSALLPTTAFALVMRQRMHELGEPEVASAQVAAKNFAHGLANPAAQRHKDVTVDDVLASPLVAEPIRRLHCCPVGAGAAAVVVVPSADAGSDAVGVRASVTQSDRYHPAGVFVPDLDATGRVARAAYEHAGIRPDDLDVVELHDAFAVEELVYYEQLGLCARGEAAALVEAGATVVGGEVAVNPSGGLLARGHPGGPTGIAQIVEIVEQLRGRAAGRQQHDARVGLAQMIGAGGVCVVHILGR